jgi:hypothetical protein
MGDSFFIEAKLWGKTLYWNVHEGLHRGGKGKGYSSYKSKEEANKVIKKLKAVFASQIIFIVKPTDELPFIKRQLKERKRNFKQAARLVVESQNGSYAFLLREMDIRPDQAELLIKRLVEQRILGDTYGRKAKNHWQVEHQKARHVLVRSLPALEKILKHINWDNV